MSSSTGLMIFPTGTASHIIRHRVDNERALIEESNRFFSTYIGHNTSSAFLGLFTNEVSPLPRSI
jgi:hypothetical protein